MLNNIFFLDIETVSNYENYEELDTRGKQLWHKKNAYHCEQKQISPQDLYRQRAAISPEFSKVICISVGIIIVEKGEKKIKITSFYETENKNEQETLIELKKLFDKYPEYYLCAHNGKEFDFPFLARRLLMNSISLPLQLNLRGKKPWEITHLDTMELWKFGDYRAFVSLDLLAYSLGIESPKETIDGSQVHEVYYKEKNMKGIIEYCERDVVTLINVYLKIIEEDTINKSNIIINDINH